jgi:nicotinamidase/pyrazinamidase
MSTKDVPTRRDAVGLVSGAVVAGAAMAATSAKAQSGLTIVDDDVFVVVDVQYDFLPGGSLPVAKGDEVIPLINAIARKFKHVVLTQDWHPAGHISFASAHPGKKPFEVTQLSYGPQVLWPDHCIWKTRGAEIAEGIDVPGAQLVIRKGYNPHSDGYSAFLDADRKTPTGLASYLKERGFKRVVCAGLATDFCVSWTAQDSRKSGFDTVVIEDATRAIDIGGSLAKAWDVMNSLGVVRVQSSAVL